MIVEYYLVIGSDYDVNNFSKQVQKYIGKGYEPYGLTTATTIDNIKVRFAQAMVKRDYTVKPGE